MLFLTNDEGFYSNRTNLTSSCLNLVLRSDAKRRVSRDAIEEAGPRPSRSTPNRNYGDTCMFSVLAVASSSYGDVVLNPHNYHNYGDACISSAFWLLPRRKRSAG